ncbi:hypothetical protein HY968_01455 [Candidatus Kaiserbacteria bacterium]|nr:hypothetical protein [Candidatus Kaiserbacteria bacterium]
MGGEAPEAPHVIYQRDIQIAAEYLKKAKTVGDVQEVLQSFIDSHKSYLVVDDEAAELTAPKALRLESKSPPETPVDMQIPFTLHITRNDGEERARDMDFKRVGNEISRHDVSDFMDRLVENWRFESM